MSFVGGVKYVIKKIIKIKKSNMKDKAVLSLLTILGFVFLGIGVNNHWDYVIGFGLGMILFGSINLGQVIFHNFKNK
jgi:asparagine N-glycosylation enzyme membrane subunit Stt3